jgi:hypothetical protein
MNQSQQHIQACFEKYLLILFQCKEERGNGMVIGQTNRRDLKRISRRERRKQNV